MSVVGLCLNLLFGLMATTCTYYSSELILFLNQHGAGKHVDKRCRWIDLPVVHLILTVLTALAGEGLGANPAPMRYNNSPISAASVTPFSARVARPAAVGVCTSIESDVEQGGIRAAAAKPIPMAVVNMTAVDTGGRRSSNGV